MRMLSAIDIQLLKERSRNIRKSILRMTTAAGSGHIAGPMSSVDVITYIYSHLHVGPMGRDKFILSCAHYAPSLYATLAEIGVIKQEELITLRKFGSRLQGHVVRQPEIGIETTGGSLGQGLGIACGIAKYFKYKSESDPSMKDKVYCMVSDGEIQEGSIWEAAMFASKSKLDNLICILDKNGTQLSGDVNTQMPLGDIEAKWKSFGWEVIKVNGHDFRDIDDAFQKTNEVIDKPILILSFTTAGKGVSFIENNYKWHGKVLNEDQLKDAIAELDRNI